MRNYPWEQRVERRELAGHGETSGLRERRIGLTDSITTIPPAASTLDTIEGRASLGVEGVCNGTTRPTRILTALALVIFTFLLLTPGIDSDFWDRDEAEYAEVAHEALASGKWMVLTLFDKPYAEKPPLSIWLTAYSFRAFGESSLSGRLPHVLLASLSPAVLFAIGLGIARTAEAGAAALLLSTSLLFLASARLLLTDSALLFFDLLAVLAIQRVASTRRHFRWILLAALALGLALLTKGPLAYVAPGLIGVGTLLTRRAAPRATLALAIRLALSIILGSVVALPWYVLAARSTAGASVSSFLLREHLFRFTNVMEGHRGSPLLACGVLFFGAYPWSAAFLRLFRRRTLTTGPPRLGVWTWGLGILVLFSLSATFLPHYLLLAMPAFALLVVIAGPSTSRLERRAVCWVSAAVGSSLFLAAVFGIQRTEFPDLVAPVVYVFAGAAILAISMPLLPEGIISPKNMLIGCALVALSFSLAIPATLDRARGLAQLGKATKLQRLPGEPVGGLSLREPSLRYYADARTIWKSDSAEGLLAAAGGSATHSVLVWLTDREALAFARARKGRIQVLTSVVNVIESGPKGLVELCRIRIRFGTNPKFGL
jgi:4-amino-4-deoxy-L-arabinose transferase-like glycosyltransferase